MKPPSHPPSWREAVGFFLREYLPRHRGVSVRTQESYATALRLLLERVDRHRIGPRDLDVPTVLRFLDSLERARQDSATSRNVRLAALKSFWKAMSLWDSGHRDRYEALLGIPFKRMRRRTPDYFEVDELRRLFGVIDAATRDGFRDLTMLRYFYNTGSRISEVADARIGWLSLTERPEVSIRGKGGTCRVCPLWPTTAEMLRVYLRQERRSPRKGYEEYVFITRRGTAFTRGGLWKMLRGYFRRAAAAMESLQRKRLTPHSLRHTTAGHLLRSGVEINVIKGWLGHADVSTTSQYLDLDLDKKREALERFLKLDVERLTRDPRASAPLPAPIVSWLERL